MSRVPELAPSSLPRQQRRNHQLRKSLQHHRAVRADAMAVHHNKTGYRGMIWCNDKQKFRAQLGSKKRNLGYFDNAKDAAAAYDEAARKRYGDHAYLNFPLPGENQVRRGDGKLFCPKGHAYSKHGYHTPNGRTNCRKCNAAAARYYKQRKRRQTIAARAYGNAAS